MNRKLPAACWARCSTTASSAAPASRARDEPAHVLLVAGGPVATGQVEEADVAPEAVLQLGHQGALVTGRDEEADVAGQAPGAGQEGHHRRLRPAEGLVHPVDQDGEGLVGMGLGHGPQRLHHPLGVSVPGVGDLDVEVAHVADDGALVDPHLLVDELGQVDPQEGVGEGRVAGGQLLDQAGHEPGRGDVGPVLAPGHAEAPGRPRVAHPIEGGGGLGVVGGGRRGACPRQPGGQHRLARSGLAGEQEQPLGARGQPVGDLPEGPHPAHQAGRVLADDGGDAHAVGRSRSVPAWEYSGQR